MHIIKLTTKELETLIHHLDTDLNRYDVSGSWGNGDGWMTDSFNFTDQPNARTKRGETILSKLINAR